MLARISSFFAPINLPSKGDGLDWKKKGDAHLRYGRFDEAEKCYQLALSLAPRNPDTHLALGFALSEHGEFDQAEVNLKLALSINPEMADAHYILGTIAKKQNKQDSAIEHYSLAIKINPNLEFAHQDLFDIFLQQEDTHSARNVIEQAVTLFPESAKFNFHLADLNFHEKYNTQAIVCYQKALSIQPDAVACHVNLANVFFEMGRYEEATVSYRQALSIAPHILEAHTGLGNVARKIGNITLAIDCYEQAVELRPRHAPTHVNLGDILIEGGKIYDSIKCYKRAIELDQKCVLAYLGLGNAHLKLKEKKEALACYEEIVRLEPNNPVKHLVAAFSGVTTHSAPSGYVENLFDQYADKFNSHLTKALNYNVPENLAALLRANFDVEDKKLVILDLGCGTGLFGMAIAPFARQLVGVDLSEKMLNKARELNLYDRLEHNNLLDMMRGEPSASYDMISAADVFVYIGILDELVNEAKRLLRPNGFFAFSVESLEAIYKHTSIAQPRDFHLNDTARYAHSITYLNRMAGDDGFEVLSTIETQSRLDHGKPIIGYLTVWLNPSL